jgi:hypothetical protein
MHYITNIKIVNPVTSCGRVSSPFLAFRKEVVTNSKGISHINFESLWFCGIDKMIYFLLCLERKH